MPPVGRGSDGYVCVSICQIFAFVPASVGTGFKREALKSLQPNNMWVKTSLKVRCRGLTGNFAGGIIAIFGVTFERCNL